jgi:HEAT repeat protein
MALMRKPAGQIPVRREADPLAVLIHGSTEERWGAARSVAALPGGVAALTAALATEADARVRSAMFTSMARLASSDCVDAIVPYLRCDDANLRTGALDALRSMPNAVLPRLPGLLSDPDADVRLLTCEIVRGLGTAEATPLLCDLLGRESEVNVCASAVDVLAEIGGPHAVAALRDCADRFPGEVFLGFAIKMAIQRIGSP